jgi:hypothetical protein
MLSGSVFKSLGWKAVLAGILTRVLILMSALGLQHQRFKPLYQILLYHHMIVRVDLADQTLMRLRVKSKTHPYGNYD